jgi:hypothetical protein
VELYQCQAAVVHYFFDTLDFFIQEYPYTVNKRGQFTCYGPHHVRLN